MTYVFDERSLAYLIEHCNVCINHEELKLVIALAFPESSVFHTHVESSGLFDGSGKKINTSFLHYFAVKVGEKETDYYQLVIEDIPEEKNVNTEGLLLRDLSDSINISLQQLRRDRQLSSSSYQNRRYELHSKVQIGSELEHELMLERYVVENMTAEEEEYCRSEGLSKQRYAAGLQKATYLQCWFEYWSELNEGKTNCFGHWKANFTEAVDGDQHFIMMYFLPIGESVEVQLDTNPSACGQELLRKLAAFDKAAGYSLAWFFYMLQKQNVSIDVGLHVCSLYERGGISLPERHASVLMKWFDYPFLL